MPFTQQHGKGSNLEVAGCLVVADSAAGPLRHSGIEVPGLAAGAAATGGLPIHQH